MNEKDILDAPEEQEVSLKITLKSVLLAILGFSIIFPLFFTFDSWLSLTSYDFPIWKFKLDLSKLLFVSINCVGLYLFISFIKFELQHWFRVMTISICINLIPILISAIYLLWPLALNELIIAIKPIAFISVMVGGGCSLAAQFLHKKNYLIFFVFMISTLAVFSLIEYL